MASCFSGGRFSCDVNLFYSSWLCPFDNLQVVKYWPEIGKCGFLVWRYLLRRDDVEPAPWSPEGIERSKKLGLKVQVRKWII